LQSDNVLKEEVMGKKTFAFAFVAVTGLILGGCKSSSTGMITPQSFKMTLGCNPSAPEVNQEVECIYTADAEAGLGILWARADFEDDGVWDVTRFYGYTMVVDGVMHSYPTAGSFKVRVEIESSDGRTDSRTRTIAVHTP
jgi:hypothetical protein